MTFKILFILFFSLLGTMAAKATLSTDGANGFLQHLANYRADMAAASAENTYLQNDANDNSQAAQDIIKDNPQLNAAINTIIPQQVNGVLGTLNAI